MTPNRDSVPPDPAGDSSKRGEGPLSPAVPPLPTSNFGGREEAPTLPVAVLNGRFIPTDRLSLPITDLGVTHGAMVTDVCRTYGGRLFRYADHLQRFLHDCTACHITLAFTPQQIADWAKELVACNAPHHETCELLLNTFATPTTLVMRTAPLDIRRYADGVTLWPTPPHSAASGLLPPTIKHRNRFHWYIAERLAPPGTIPVTTDERGHLLETAVGNVILVRAGAMVSAPAETVLDGISLRVVRELCKSQGIAYREQLLTTDADEVILCGTAFGLAGVRAIGERAYACPGPITRRLMAVWSGLYNSIDNTKESIV